MPRVVPYTLKWSAQHSEYRLLAKPNDVSLDLTPESLAWFEWLGQISSFVFIGKNGRYTVRKESKQRGDVYWYGYRSGVKPLSKRYVGRTTDVTIERLEAVIALWSHTPTSMKPVLEGQPSSPQQTQAEHVADSPISPFHQLDPVLSTKLHIPRPRGQLVARERLLTRLEEGIEGPVTMISAPASFGKTTLLAQWLAKRQLPAAWLSLEVGDNQSTRFLSYLIAALQKLDAGIGTASLPPLQSPQPPALETIVALLTNEIAESQVERMLLVLDDYHVITTEAIHQAMTFLIEHQPAQLHLIFLTRVDPPLPLARLRARGQLIEFRSRDLRFERNEAATFLRDVMAIDLTDADVDLLEKRTEGWVMGLQLAALSLRGKQDIPAFLRSFSGSHRFIFEYLSDEILAHQPEPVLSFLLHTCILERMCAALCSAMLAEEMGRSEHDCQEMLEALEKANLFVHVLDDEREWYRYHQLFAVVLQTRLSHTSPDLVPLLHQRASRWFERQGSTREAIHHALVIGDVKRVVTLLQPLVWNMFFHGEIDILLNWLKRVPDDLERQQPLLCLYHAAALGFIGQSDAAEEYLMYAGYPGAEHVKDEHSMPASASSGEIAAIKTMIAAARGDLPQAAAMAQHARLHLPTDNVFLRSMVIGSESLICAINGDFRAAIRCLWEINSLLQPVDNPFTLHRGMTGFAFYLLHLGQLRQVIATCEQALQLQGGPQGRKLPFAGTLYITLGIGYYERNELEAAKQMATQGIALCEQMGEFQFLCTGYALLAQIVYLEQLKTQSHIDPTPEVRALMQQAETLLWKEPIKLFWAKNYSAYFLVRLWLVQKNREAILRLEHFCPIDEQACSTPGCHYTLQTMAWALAYIRFAQQRPDRTVALLHWPIQAAEPAGHMHRMVRLLILQALGYCALGQTTEALTTLKRALYVGEPEGYCSAFVEMGEPIAQLLLTLWQQEWSKSPHEEQEMQNYVQHLLLQYPQTRSSIFTSNALEGLVEANQPCVRHVQQVLGSGELLTARELEILQQMGAGHSNQEIAAHLVVEVSTIKWHIHHIYSKLQVKNRTHAILRAQEIGIL